MLIIGAKGFAKEILEVCHLNNVMDHLVFYDDVNSDIRGKLYNRFEILKSLPEAKKYFENITPQFTIGIGNPLLREILYEKFSNIGGVFTSTISPTAIIGHYGNIIGSGSNIMQSVVITNDVIVGKGCIINQISSIGHDVTIGDFTEICPNVSISGNCKIGNKVFIGTSATILPAVRIGNNVSIGAGAVVNSDIPDNAIAVGIPAKIIKYKDE